MLPHHDENGFMWYDSLDEAKPHYTPIKVRSWLQFFMLKPRVTTISKDNLMPIENLVYCYKHPQEEKYYVRRHHIASYEEMETLAHEEIRILRARIDAGTVYLLFTLQNIADTTAMLQRLYKGHFKTPGKVEYPLYLSLLEATIKTDSYREDGKSLIGYKTAMHTMEMALADLWLTAKK